MTFRHRAGVSPYTSSFDLAETCVFGKQSVGPIHCGPLELHPYGLHSTRASLLPKLRDHFAEFLNEGSLDHLSILYLPTCVGFGTGTLLLAARLFSEVWRLALGGLWPPGIAPQVMRRRIYGATPTCLPQDNHRLLAIAFLVPPRVNGNNVVQEYQPVGHRLRLSASP